MTTRSDVDRLSAAQRRLVQLAQNEIAAYFATLDLSRPDAVRDALLEIVPLLVREYGDLAAVAAAEWYEEVRPGTYTARLGTAASEAAVRGSVRTFAGALFGEEPQEALSALGGAIQRHILYSARSTIGRNAQVDPLRPRFARVPTGAKTCAWCSMLASRGFVYWSKQSAGIVAGHYHDDCNCAIVASFDRGAAHIDGYDPDRLYDQYMTARSAVEASGRQPTDKSVAEQLRAMFPGEFTDSHVH